MQSRVLTLSLIVLFGPVLSLLYIFALILLSIPSIVFLSLFWCSYPFYTSCPTYYFYTSPLDAYFSAPSISLYYVLYITLLLLLVPFLYFSAYLPIPPLPFLTESVSCSGGFELDSLGDRGILYNRRRLELSRSLNRYWISSYLTVTSDKLDLYLTETNTSQELLAQFKYAQETKESDSESDLSVILESSVSSGKEALDLRLPEPCGNLGITMMMANMGFTKQMTSSGEGDSLSVDKFLDNLELIFLVIEGNFTAPE